ncbi:hypothetical protein A2572_02355 [Candidatus Collierbacteria bacterium RIFOXYD1_FULL_40_9]|uniref:Uncharacterized protein n=1 Tax=Candidatus Collierbacteria bacterium RIFOXYD1_FULL_40_9 TaxID=1817731 RepID=A0A1F5FP08_9BACT|nr:MAG: hypothetical protein A2572_02355 [Candidatus Collierbacteria bacterium RIFOXYD1_FULL_40_9]
MEKLINQQLLNKEKLISEAYAEKKGRELFGDNLFTCFAVVDSPQPDLSTLTLSLLSMLKEKTSEAFLWTKQWDKTIVSIASGQKSGCYLLDSQDNRGKLFVPVATNKLVDSAEIASQLPKGELATIAINSAPMTIEAFIISYFHMVNELVWDVTIANSVNEEVNESAYRYAVDAVSLFGFDLSLLPETELLKIRKKDPSVSLRVYGSKVNKYVPEVIGAVIKKK